ncbi:solute carrier family 25 protein [Patescibacteria group bacterium]|nr:solute carrier family 25 protein [Patescibacteria group bacterium]
MTMLRTPFDIVKQHLQVNGMKKDAALPTTATDKLTVRRILQLIRETQGRKGYFTGVTVTIARDCCFSGSYFFSYEVMKYLQHKFVNYPDPIKHMIAGGTAGFIGTVISLPIDVVKTRIQTQATLPLELR